MTIGEPDLHPDHVKAAAHARSTGRDQVYRRPMDAGPAPAAIISDYKRRCGLTIRKRNSVSAAAPSRSFSWH